MLTGAEIDQTAGLLILRERTPFTLYATAATLAAVAANPMFGALAPDVVPRRAIGPGERFTLPGGIEAELFMVPGKVPLYLEGDDPEIGAESAANVGIETRARRRKRLVYRAGRRRGDAGADERLARADVVLFDGTLFTDDEMIAAAPARRPAAAWAICRSTARAARCRRSRLAGAAHLHPHQQHQSDPGRRLAGARAVEAAGWEVAEDGMEIVL